LENFEDIIKEITKTIFCPICKRHYNVKEVNIRGFIDDKLILQSTCSDNHEPAAVIFIVKTFIKNKNVNFIKKIDVELFKKNILNFNGNFKNL